MGELRWILLVSGLLLLGGIYLYTRFRSNDTTPDKPPRREPGLGDLPAQPDDLPDEATVAETASSSADEPDRVIALRLMARERSGFPAERLVLALRELGLRHGRFGIFHAHEDGDTGSGAIQFSIASLVEPGSFDLSRMKDSSYPGVSLFLALPCAGDAITSFDRMLETARSLAESLDGDLLDEQGSTLSIQRQRFLREEILQYLHQQESRATRRDAT